MKLIILLLYLVEFSTCINVYANNKSYNFYTPVIRRFSPDEFSNLSSTISLDTENTQGNIILLHSIQGYSIEYVVSLQMHRNPIGLIIESLVDGTVGTNDVLFSGITGHSSTVDIPTVEISQEDMASLFNLYASDNNLTVEIYQGDYNTWLEYFGLISPYNIFFRIMTFLWSSVNIGLIIYRYVKMGTCIVNLARICLSIELALNTIKLIWCIDPFGDPEQIFTWMVDNICTTLPWSLGLLNTLLISLYWKTLLDKRNMGAKINIMNKLKRPLIVILVLFCIEEVTFIILRSLYFDMKTLAYANGLGYVSIAAGTSFLYCYVVYKLRQEYKDEKKTSNVINRINKLVVLIAIGNILFLLTGLIILAPSFWTPKFFWVTITAMSVPMHFTSTMQILIFRPIKRTKGVTVMSGTPTSDLTSSDASTTSN